MKRTTATGSTGGLFVDRVAGIQAGTKVIAEDQNNHQEELCHAIEGVGIALDGTDRYQLEKAIIARSHLVGQIIETEFKLTPVTWAAAKSSTNPSNADYLPVIARTADVDVTSTQAPDLVTKLRAEVATVQGVSSWLATVSGSVITLPNTTGAVALVTQLQEDALVQRWLTSSQSATYAASGADFSSPRCINVAGTDYAITAVSVASRTITVSGSPATGTQTVAFYPYRIAGSTTSVRLHKLTGFVGVAQGDSDGQYIGGLRMMDRMQGHDWYIFYDGGSSSSLSGNISGTPYQRRQVALDEDYIVSSSGSSPASVGKTNGGQTGNGNGTPRMAGKTTDPRGHARYVYTWAGRLIA